MENFLRSLEIRWSDLDPNFHLRHSVYYDWGALCRISYLEKYGLSEALLKKLGVGPILLREECVFRREIRMGDIVDIKLELLSATRDYARWSIRHQVIKNKEMDSAMITVDGAWLDTQQRKLTEPAPEIVSIFAAMPVTDAFSWTD